MADLICDTCGGPILSGQEFDEVGPGHQFPADCVAHVRAACEASALEGVRMMVRALGHYEAGQTRRVDELLGLVSTLKARLDSRVTELLQANEAEVNKRRAAEKDAAQARDLVTACMLGFNEVMERIRSAAKVVGLPLGEGVVSLDAIGQLAEKYAALHRARPLSEFDAEGPALFHRMPICEPPYAGSPDSSDWPYSEEDEPNIWWTPLPDCNQICDRWAELNSQKEQANGQA